MSSVDTDTVLVRIVGEDGLSKPAKTAAEALDKLGRKVSETSAAVSGFGTAVYGWGSSVSGFGDKVADTTPKIHKAKEASDDLAKSWEAFAKGSGPALASVLGLAAAGGAAVAGTFYGAVQASDRLKAQVDLLGSASTATLAALGDAISGTTAWSNLVEAVSGSLDTLRVWLEDNQTAVDKLAKEGLNQLFSAAMEAVPAVVLLANALLSLKPIVETVMLGYKYAAPLFALSPAGGAAWIAKAASSGELQRDVKSVGDSWGSAGNLMLKIDSLGEDMRALIGQMREGTLTGGRVITFTEGDARKAGFGAKGRRGESAPAVDPEDYPEGQWSFSGASYAEASAARKRAVLGTMGLEGTYAEIQSAGQEFAKQLESKARMDDLISKQERARIDKEKLWQDQLAQGGVQAATSLGTMAVQGMLAGESLKSLSASLLQAAGKGAQGLGQSLVGQGGIASAVGAGLIIGGAIAEQFGNQQAAVDRRRAMGQAARDWTTSNPLPVHVVKSDLPQVTAVTMYVSNGGRTLTDVGAEAARALRAAQRAGRA